MINRYMARFGIVSGGGWLGERGVERQCVYGRYLIQSYVCIFTLQHTIKLDRQSANLTFYFAYH